MKMKPIYSLLMLLALLAATVLAPGTAMAETDDLDLDPELRALLAGQSDIKVYHFPEIAPTYSAYIGYRAVDYSGPRSLMRFGELEDSVLFRGDYRAFWFPSRFYIVYDREGQDDYFGELRYALGDGIFLRWYGSGVHRNPESVAPVDLDTATAFPGVSVNDAGAEYGIGKNSEDIFLRFKAPDFPAHLFAKAWMVHEEGSMQERTLLGSGYFNELVRDTSVREYGWETHSYTVGANSHLGPVEVQLTHSADEFKMNSDESTVSFYNANAYRAAGFYEHHLYPGFEGSEDAIEVHTSLTGRLVVSATMSARTNENSDTGAQADYLMGTAGVTWMPRTSLTFVMRYSHEDLDYDDGIQLASIDLINSPHSGMSTVKDSVSLALRYRPIPALAIRAKYRRESTDRDGAYDWGLASDRTVTETYTVSARSRQIKGLIVKADASYATTDSPAYNTDNDSYQRLRASADWRASSRVNTFLSYTGEASRRHDLDYGNSVKADNRVTYRDQGRAGLTFTSSEAFSITGSVNYYLNSVRQDLIYDLGGTPVVSPDAVYEDRIQGAAIDMSYVPTEKLALTAGVSVSSIEGSFKTHNQDLLAPIPVSDLVDQDLTMTQVNVGGTYELPAHMDLEFSYSFLEMSEDKVNPYDSLSDGDVQVVAVMVGKKW